MNKTLLVVLVIALGLVVLSVPLYRFFIHEVAILGETTTAVPTADTPEVQQLESGSGSSVLQKDTVAGGEPANRPTATVLGVQEQIEPSMTLVRVRINNVTNIPITNVRLAVTCGDGPEQAVTEKKILCDRTKEVKSLNRMTNRYETRSYAVCDPLNSKKSLEISVSVPGAFEQNDCSVELKGYTDYRTITQ